MGFDPLRITVGVWGLGMTGFEVAEQLEKCHGVVVELATSKVWEREIRAGLGACLPWGCTLGMPCVATAAGVAAAAILSQVASANAQLGQGTER